MTLVLRKQSDVWKILAAQNGSPENRCHRSYQFTPRRCGALGKSGLTASDDKQIEEDNKKLAAVRDYPWRHEKRNPLSRQRPPSPRLCARAAPLAPRLSRS